MGQQQSRSSPDGEQRQRATLSPGSAKKTRCPSCRGLQVSTVNVDGELTVRICGECNRGYGVDDSMDADTLALFLTDEELCSDVRMSAVSCDRCSNDDMDRFVIIDHDPSSMILRVRCIDCDNDNEIRLQAWNSEGQDSVVEEMYSTKFMADKDESDSGSLVPDDSDSGCVQFDDDYLTYYKDDSVDILPFSCVCGNHEVSCFQQHVDHASGDLSRVTCLVCDHEKVVEMPFFVECWHCKNDKKELFERQVDEYGRLALLRCFVCGKRLHIPGKTVAAKERAITRSNKLSYPRRKSDRSKHDRSPGARGTGLGWTKMTDLRNVRRGDHIAWHKWYAIWHHAIVVDVPDDGLTLTVIHYSGHIVKLDGHLASVRLETIDVHPQKEDLYRIDYPGETYSVAEVVVRASVRLGEAKYNPVTNNCEHFARWCKTGRAESGQVHKFTDRLRLASPSAVIKATQEVMTNGIEPLSVGLKGVGGRVGKVFGATSGAARNAKCGAIACGVAVSLALEASLFTKDAVIAYRKYKSGAISRDEFKRRLCKSGCECAGGFVGSSAMGILGQVLIPVPVLGGLIGCTLGNLIGRYTGAVVGKQLGSIKN